MVSTEDSLEPIGIIDDEGYHYEKLRRSLMSSVCKTRYSEEIDLSRSRNLDGIVIGTYDNSTGKIENTFYDGLNIERILNRKDLIAYLKENFGETKEIWAYFKGKDVTVRVLRAFENYQRKNDLQNHPQRC